MWSQKLIIISLCLYSSFSVAEWKGNIEYVHVSGIETKEYGLNAVFVGLKYQRSGFYIVGSLGLHDESLDCPEVCFGSNFLGQIRAGWEISL